MNGWMVNGVADSVHESNWGPLLYLFVGSHIWADEKAGMNELEKSVAMSMLPPDKNDKKHTNI